MIYREVEGLPKGSVKAVIDAYGELVDEGCLVVFGPNITDNCVPMREAIEERFKVPAISVTGTDDWLGEWTFAFPQGSMTDEPIFIADLLAKRDLSEIGVLVEQSLIGQSYLANLRSACRRKGIRIVAEVRDRPDRPGHQSRPCAVCTKRRPRRSCTWASDSASCSSTPRWKRWTGIRPASPPPPSRMRG